MDYSIILIPYDKFTTTIGTYGIPSCSILLYTTFQSYIISPIPPRYQQALTLHTLPPPGQSDIKSAISRYLFYTHHGVPDSQIAPYQTAWEQNIRALLPLFPTGPISQYEFDEMVQTMLTEVQDDYQTAMKRSIVNYIIQSPVERSRLGLEDIEPLLAL